MKGKKFVTTFYKLVPTEELDKKYRTMPTDYTTDVQIGSKSRAFAEYFDEQVFLGSALLYPVRIANVYILSTGYKSYIFPDTAKLYKYLVSTNCIQDSEELKDQFSGHNILDLKEISRISGGAYSRIFLEPYMLAEEDIYFETSRKTIPYDICIIPCLHEEKAMIEIFVETAYLTDVFLNKLEEEGFQEYQANFDTPLEVVEEWAKGVYL